MTDKTDFLCLRVQNFESPLGKKTPLVFNLHRRTDNKALFRDLKLFPQVGG